jgi:hypothetical protein
LTKKIHSRIIFNFLNMKKNISVRFVLMAVWAIFAQLDLSAQAQLSFQGILKRSNGLAVNDNFYRITFTLYNAETLGTARFTETIDSVEVTGGIYSVILGSGSTPLNATFNEDYWLGIKVDGPSAAEMTPRIRLTSAPYALALRGLNNSFPSSGVVIADSMRAKGKIVARAGEPGANSSLNNGFGFSVPGDRDGGLYSEADGQVAIWANNSERILVSNTGSDSRIYLRSNVTVDNSLQVGDQLNVTGNVTSDLKLASGKTLQYSGFSDWRLVARQDVLAANGLEGWFATTALNNNTTTGATLEVRSYDAFNGDVVRPTGSNQHILKKQFDLSGVGSYSRIKVKFKYYFTDSWDSDDTAIGGFCTTDTGNNAAICWMDTPYVYSTSGLGNYIGSTNFSDGAKMGEMVANTGITSFYVFFGMRTVSGDINNERYAISDIEVWVR